MYACSTTLWSYRPTRPAHACLNASTHARTQPQPTSIHPHLDAFSKHQPSLIDEVHICLATRIIRLLETISLTSRNLGRLSAQPDLDARGVTTHAQPSTPRHASPCLGYGPWGKRNLQPAACHAMMTMTMSSPQCRNHGLSGACSQLPLERQPLYGLARKQTHQSGCLLYLFRHAFMNEGLAALHAQSQSFSPSRKPKSSPREKASVASDSLRSSHTLAVVSQPWPCRGSLRAVCRHTPGDVIILPSPPPATPWKFPRSQVSRILDWDLRVPSMPSRQPVGPVTAWASLFQRTSLTSHLGSRATQKSDLYSMAHLAPG